MCESERECVHMNPILATTQRSGCLILVVGNYGRGEGETKDAGGGQVPFSIPPGADTWPQLTRSPTCQLQHKQGSVTLARALCGKPFYATVQPNIQVKQLLRSSKLCEEGLSSQPPTSPEFAPTPTQMP